MCEKSTKATREEQIQRAYDDLRTAKTELYEISERDLATHDALKKAESAVLLKYSENPKELGGNEPARNARIREIVASERADVEKSEAEKRKIQLTHDLSNARIQELQWLVRNDQAIADLDAQGYVA